MSLPESNPAREHPGTTRRALLRPQVRSWRTPRTLTLGYLRTCPPPHQRLITARYGDVIARLPTRTDQNRLRCQDGVGAVPAIHTGRTASAASAPAGTPSDHPGDGVGPDRRTGLWRGPMD